MGRVAWMAAQLTAGGFATLVSCFPNAGSVFGLRHTVASECRIRQRRKKPVSDGKIRTSVYIKTVVIFFREQTRNHPNRRN